LKASDDGFFSKNFCEKSELHRRFGLKNKQNRLSKKTIRRLGRFLLDCEAESAEVFLKVTSLAVYELNNKKAFQIETLPLTKINRSF